LDSNQVFQIQSTFGFVPLGELPVVAGPPGPTINVNVADYLRVINGYAGLPNYICKTAPVASHLNLNLLRYWAQGHHDLQVCDLLEFGFPLDLDRHKFISNSSIINHGSSSAFPAEVSAYFAEEIAHGAVLGPFKEAPVSNLNISPIMTAPKDGGARRVIVDLSFPSVHNMSVNALVAKNVYLETPFILKLPTVDTICEAISKFGCGVKL
jgi:hypothetical protein